ncbi:hypothetical protein LNA01_21950 [Companilactobacillus nantensis]|nr:hypothetical protein LNA01_21950 [Companilactobacillus nantensis]
MLEVIFTITFYLAIISILISIIIFFLNFRKIINLRNKNKKLEFEILDKLYDR